MASNNLVLVSSNVVVIFSPMLSKLFLRSKISLSSRLTSMIIWQLFFSMFDSTSCPQMKIMWKICLFVNLLLAHRESCEKVVDRIFMTLSLSLESLCEETSVSFHLLPISLVFNNIRSATNLSEIIITVDLSVLQIVIFIVISLNKARHDTLLRIKVNMIHTPQGHDAFLRPLRFLVYLSYCTLHSLLVTQVDFVLIINLPSGKSSRFGQILKTCELKLS